MLTGVDDPSVADQALEIGAYGYLVKPVGGNEALINVSSNLRRRELELARLQHVEELESKILDRTTALRDALAQLELTEANMRDAERDAVDRLVTALTIRSEETGAHIRRVGRFSALLARRAGVRLWSEDEICLAAMLHDVGKIGIPDSILLKPGPLDAEERAIIQRHSLLGNRMLADGRSAVLILGAQIALAHHERWDGAGYPNGLARDEIPVAGRIAAIADVFDALTSDRVYRGALPVSEAVDEMRSQAGRQFDPDLLELFFGSLDRVHANRAAHPDPHCPRSAAQAASASGRTLNPRSSNSRGTCSASRRACGTPASASASSANVSAGIRRPPCASEAITARGARSSNDSATSRTR
jgi:putative two-component system response regulator